MNTPSTNRPFPLYRAAELRQIEMRAADLPLMQRAGRAAADRATALCDERGASILVLAGPGNNGGDAFEAARLLAERFFDVRVVFAGEADRLPDDAAAAYRRLTEAGGTTLSAIPPGVRWSLIIDGLFGIGLKRAIEGRYAEFIETANALALRDGCPLLALDCPSGLDADTGKRRGATIRASQTITFIGGKPGLFTADGPDYAGCITLAALGLEDRLPAAPGVTLTPAHFAAHLIARAQNSHKGRYGDAGIVGGDTGMVGAPLLAARAALRLGAGRVLLGLLAPDAPTVDWGQPELMIGAPERLLSGRLAVLACGPGLGLSDNARALLERACRLGHPLVLDADALTLVAADPALQNALTRRTAPTLLTPHPAEAGRLLGIATGDVQADRIAAAQTLAARYRACVAVKGCGTVVATPAGEWSVNTTGNPGLATAGSGDVLTGMTAALLAQGWPPHESLLAAVHLHGLAADRLVAQGTGPVGLTAGELADSARSVLNGWIAENGKKQLA